MKLYTEQQVMEMLRIAKNTYELIDNIINEFNEIELPSDEEIEMAAPYVPRDAHDYYVGDRDGFIEGAKWMRDKIKGGEQ